MFIGMWTAETGGEFLYGGILENLNSNGVIEIPEGEDVAVAGVSVVMDECISVSLGFSDYLRNKILDKVLRGVNFQTAPPYVSAHDGSPGMTGANERSGVLRKLVAASGWLVPVGPYSENTHDIRLTGIPAGDVTHVALWDALIGGNFLIGAALTVPRLGMVDNATLRLRAGELRIFMDVCGGD
jgi:hypothetical protein